MTGAPNGGWGTGQDGSGPWNVPPEGRSGPHQGGAYQGGPSQGAPHRGGQGYSQRQPDSAGHRQWTPPPPPPPGSRPIGPQESARISIDAYKPPKRRVGALLAFLLGFAVLIGGFMTVSRLARTSETSSSATPSVSATLPGLAFETDSATGSWEITDTHWSADHVVLTVHVTVATGSFRYSFYAYNNNAMRLAYPDSGSSNTLRSGTLGPGQSVSGTLSFQLTRGDGTLVMLDAMENQVSGLPIKP